MNEAIILKTAKDQARADELDRKRKAADAVIRHIHTYPSDPWAGVRMANLVKAMCDEMEELYRAEFILRMQNERLKEGWAFVKTGNIMEAAKKFKDI